MTESKNGGKGFGIKGYKFNTSVSADDDDDDDVSFFL